jgi:HEAT repeat protein
MRVMRAVALLWTLWLAPQDDPAMDALVAALEGDVPEERDRAQKSLIDLGERALPRLKRVAGRASGETRARLAEIVREIELRIEEASLAKAGLPARLAREVPRFRERFFSRDEKVVLDVLEESLQGRKAGPESDSRTGGSVEIDAREIEALLRSVLERAKDSPLKSAAIRWAGRHSVDRLGDVLPKLLDDPDPGVRRALLESSSAVRVTGAEEVFGRLLQEGSGEERKFALEGLDRLRTQKARRKILVALADPLPDLREEAVQLLSWAGEEAAIPGILRLLRDPEGRVRYAAVLALQKFRVHEALEDILALKDDEDEDVRRGVVGLIGSWRDPRGETVVLRALEKPGDGSVFLQAIVSAGSLGLKEALPILMSLLPGEEVESADAAARVIAEIGPGAHEAELLKMARGADALLRRRALRSLAGAGPSQDALAAVRRAVSDPDVSVRQAAVAVLGKARGSEVLGALGTALKDGTLRMDVLGALAESPQPGAGRLASEFLDDPDVEVVERAFEVIERQHVVEAIPKLEKLLEHPVKRVAAGAASALHRLAGPRAFPAMLRALDRAEEETKRRIWNCFELDPDETLVEAAIDWIPRLPREARNRAFWVIADYPCAKSTEFLLKVIRDPKGDGRPRALQSLLQRGNAEAQRMVREEFRTTRGRDRLDPAWYLVDSGLADDVLTQVLLEELKGCDERLWHWFLRPLFEARRPEVKPLLLEGLRSSEGDLRDDMAKGLALYPKGSFDRDLRTMAASPDETARRGAARGLTHLEMPDRLDLLRKLLGDPVAFVRSEAIVAFGAVKPKDVPAELAALLADPADEVRKGAVEAVGRLDPALLQSRAEALLSDRSPGVREKAASAVGRGKIQVAPAALEKLLDDPEGPVRAAAARAIGVLGHQKSAGKLIRTWQDDPEGWVRSSSAQALLEMGHERGLEAVRSFVNEGAPEVNGSAAITLMERADRGSVPAALGFVGRSSHIFDESNRTLFAMNALTQPELYRKSKETTIDLRGWRGSEREWIEKLGQALGLRVEVDPGVPEFTLAGQKHEGLERALIEELTSLGVFLNAAGVLEPGRLRVMRRLDAVDFWERWHREGR